MYFFPKIDDENISLDLVVLLPFCNSFRRKSQTLGIYHKEDFNLCYYLFFSKGCRNFRKCVANPKQETTTS